MKPVNLQALTNHLRSIESDYVFLSFSHIESMIDETLPQKARSPKWWYNIAERKRSQAWLSAGFQVIRAKDIPARGGVEFQRYPQTTRNTIKYGRALRLFFDLVITLIISLIASLIILKIEQNIQLNKEIHLIETYSDTHNYEKLEEKVLEVTPILEKKKNYHELCVLYDKLFDVNFEQATSSDTKLNESQLSKMQELCAHGILYANEGSLVLYNIKFNNNLGKMFQYQYNKTLDVRDANKALEFFEIADDAYAEIGNGLIPVMKSFNSVEDIDTAYAGLEANTRIFDLYYSLIVNGEYTKEELSEKSLEAAIDNNNVFFRLFQYYGRSIMIQFFDITSQLEKTQYKYQPDQSIILRSLSIDSRFSSLMYVLTRKYDLGMFKEESFSYQEIEEKLKRVESVAIQIQDYPILSITYFELARINFFNYIFDNDEDSLTRFNSYIMLWLEVSDKGGISLQELDRCFSGITGGELLDLYIEEVKQSLAEISLQDNPSLYGYTEWDLGRHYYYKAQNLIRAGESKEQINDALYHAGKHCALSLLFFSEETNSRLYDEINNLLSDIDELKTEYR